MVEKNAPKKSSRRAATLKTKKAPTAKRVTKKIPASAVRKPQKKDYSNW